ncbi:asparagine synthetase B [Streptomyces longispororuber]|uniref:asparagine synthase (glutamine-hydrolyzing) n=1 Tax=Streptomyces longispororuber TaxID=68230 RepID=A0A918ZVM8_9ACTN|nr:asparagine synthase (glutamine-hydrolyzing) [Streptomyces longispororuber]GHE70942.1 asparagine synthetase B [Streptomyces longispororuber]
MCGIVGWVDYEHDLSSDPSLPATARSMTDTLACRGPDDEGVFATRRCVLGHRRLSIIDRAGGAQPMTFTAGDTTVAALTFCGEVYNFTELRAQLEAAGHVFRTRSDTEVVLHAYLEWGEHLVDRLNGMYAFGVWDARTEELVLVRDRMGVKPLYYHRTAHGIVFGSELKALFAHPSVPRAVDREGLCEALDMVKTPGHAVFSGIHEVRPGEVLRVRRQGTLARRYWRLEAREHTEGLTATIGTVRGLLEDIVSRQLISDVPLCSLLSGGLDSSAVTALAARALKARGEGPVRSFAVDFAHAEEGFAPDAVRASPDAPFAQELAAHVGADHSEVLLDSAELADPAVRAAVLRATDLPPAFWGDMWPSLYLLFRAVRQRSTVALSGESADELFGGYLWFRNPNAVAADTFPWLTSGSARYFGGLGLLDQGLLEKLDIPGYRDARYREALAEVPVLPGEDARERRMREITYLNLTRFVQTLLDRKDRMSMAVGLEVRVPFCDHRLVEYVFNVPWAMKTFDGREKSLLRAATADLLPSSVLQRAKTPYPATLDPRYAQALRTELAGVLADPDAPVRPFLDLGKARRAADRASGGVSRPYDRGGVEMALWLDAWLRRYGVSLDI